MNNKFFSLFPAVRSILESNFPDFLNCELEKDFQRINEDTLREVPLEIVYHGQEVNRKQGDKFWLVYEGHQTNRIEEVDPDYFKEVVTETGSHEEEGVGVEVWRKIVNKKGCPSYVVEFKYNLDDDAPKKRYGVSIMVYKTEAEILGRLLKKIKTNSEVFAA